MDLVIIQRIGNMQCDQRVESRVLNLSAKNDKQLYFLIETSKIPSFRSDVTNHTTHHRT